MAEANDEVALISPGEQAASLTAKPAWLVMATTCTEPTGLWHVW